MDKSMRFKELRKEIKGTYCAGNYLKYHTEKVYGPIVLDDEDHKPLPDLEEDEYKGADKD